MTTLLASLLCVILLSADEAERIVVAREIVETEEEATTGTVLENAREAESIRISSQRADFDREDGIILFEGDARVDHSAGYHLMADRLYAVFAKSNELDRVEAEGNVRLTSDGRSGTCASAVFRRQTGEIEMCGTEDAPARLMEGRVNSIAGRRIRFWIDTEQVEVQDSCISFRKARGGVMKHE